MTLPFPDMHDADTEELLLPALAGGAAAGAATADALNGLSAMPGSHGLDGAATEHHRLEWAIVIGMLVLAMAATVALLATLWLQPGSGSVGQ